MHSENLVDPELKPFLARLPQAKLSAESLPELRGGLKASFRNPSERREEQIRFEEVWVPGRAGAPPIRVAAYRPAAAAGLVPSILHLHGGGYVLGAPEMADEANSRLASELGCMILSVDYRLAPETPYPGALEDCYTVLEWVAANAARLGIDPGRIGVKGESAGGGLAAALAILTRDRSGPKLSN